MKTCPACGEKIKDDALRCKHCGTDLNLRRCPWCAEVIEESAKKCKHCKSYIDKIICPVCGKHVPLEEMACLACRHAEADQIVAEKIEVESFKLRLRGFIFGFLLAAIIVYFTMKFFG